MTSEPTTAAGRAHARWLAFGSDLDGADPDEIVVAIEAEARAAAGRDVAALRDASRALLADQKELACGTCGGTGVAWDWPAHTDWKRALANPAAAEPKS